MEGAAGGAAVSAPREDEVAYLRNAALVTDQPVAAPVRGGRGIWKRVAPRRAHGSDDAGARSQAAELLNSYDATVDALRRALRPLMELKRPRLLGKIDDELQRVERAAAKLQAARAALVAGDLGACGAEFQDASRLLAGLGGPAALALNKELDQATFSREKKNELESNRQRRQEAQLAVDPERRRSPRAGAVALVRALELMAEGLALSAEILAAQPAAVVRPSRPPARGGSVIVAPQDLETFADVGGLEEPKSRLRATVGAMLERPAEATGAGAGHNGVLLYGPPGTGKTLLARAVAGEYGLRFLRFSPAVIASAYQSEPAAKLRQMFTLAADSAPCLLFLDEVDSIAGRREGVASPNQRELITQLLNSLEDFRSAPGLVIMAATNMLDELDPALREGRFDSRIAVPLPDLEARQAILRVQLGHRESAMAADSAVLEEVAQRTSGRSGAALASIVSGAAARALARGEPLGRDDLLAEIEGRSGQDRAQTVEDQVAWDEVVLPAATRERLEEILLVFQQPELGRSLGVKPPAGLLLYGPPGTGKTTIARALATQGGASFYEQSAADLISKWVGESEQKVAQLFTRARANRPSIIFCDEIDALLKSRSAGSAAPWEERVVSQFLRELDGLQSSEGVLLVGATNRPDIIDDAIRERRLVPIEVPLPDADGRRRLLEVLCRDVRLADDVVLDDIAAQADGMSGADLKSLRNAAGMKALTRAARGGDTAGAAVSQADFAAALAQRSGS